MTWVDIGITVLVLVMMFILLYCRLTDKTLPELIGEIREIFSPVEEVASI